MITSCRNFPSPLNLTWMHWFYLGFNPSVILTTKNMVWCYWYHLFIFFKPTNQKKKKMHTELQVQWIKLDLLWLQWWMKDSEARLPTPPRSSSFPQSWSRTLKLQKTQFEMLCKHLSPVISFGACFLSCCWESGRSHRSREAAEKEEVGAQIQPPWSCGLYTFSSLCRLPWEGVPG